MWKNKVVIITGSSIGIGFSLATEISKKGAKVILNARNKDRLYNSFTNLKAQNFDISACAGDISKYKDCKKIIEHTISNYGKLDILINNAGITAEATLEEMKPEIFKQVVDVNFLGSVFMAKAALPYIKQSKGSILFIGSVAGIHGLGNYSAYCSSKMALKAVVESLRKETYKTGIHIGLANIGFTENDSQKTHYDKNGNITALPSRKTIKQVPVKTVAHQIIKMIEKRKFKSSFTFLGKLNAIINRISPLLVHKILLAVYLKNRK